MVAKERPELQKEKETLMLEEAENKKQLKEIEDKILKVLSESQGNILDDQTAIDILSASKKISDEIAQKQAIAEATTLRLDRTREGYQPAAFRASLLFFCISDLANVDPMYQYSLTWYISLFEKAIDEATATSVLTERLDHLTQQNTVSVYRNVCRSLYEKDKLLFSFLMCTKILSGAGLLEQSQFTFFITGGTGLIPESAPKNPCEDWLPGRAWDELMRLSWMEGFEAITADGADGFKRCARAWHFIYLSEAPFNEKLPAKWETKLDFFAKMCVLRCLRPDKVVPMVMAFVQVQRRARHRSLPRAATHCHTLPYTTIHCHTLPHTANGTHSGQPVALRVGDC